MNMTTFKVSELKHYGLGTKLVVEATLTVVEDPSEQYLIQISEHDANDVKEDLLLTLKNKHTTYLFNLTRDKRDHTHAIYKDFFGLDAMEAFLYCITQLHAIYDYLRG